MLDARNHPKVDPIRHRHAPSSSNLKARGVPSTATFSRAGS